MIQIKMEESDNLYYKSFYKPNTEFWGLGIENETYLLS